MTGAIIFAAGLGKRLRPITNETPKPMIVVGGMPIIERQIRFLRERGVGRIVIVTGWHAPRVEELAGRHHGLIFVHNPEHANMNNIHSMYLVREYLAMEDTWVLDGDVYLPLNILPTIAPIHSLYLSGFSTVNNNEWALDTDDRCVLVKIRTTSDPDWIMTGISHWAQSDGRTIAGLLEVYRSRADYGDLYWDQIPRDNLDRLVIKVERIGSDDWFEIDNLDDLERVRARFPSHCGDS